MALRVRLIERGASPERTREIPVEKAEFVIGRAADCDLRLRVNEISRHHCILRLAGDEAALFDLGSSNGSYINNERVRSQAVLHSGDVIRLGPCTFVVDLGGPEGVPLDIADVDPNAITARRPKATTTPNTEDEGGPAI
jgi:pSer/pThr/pTyr-binding forkhead associated (FHA) protein